MLSMREPGYFPCPMAFVYQIHMKQSDYWPFITKQCWPRDWSTFSHGKTCSRDGFWGPLPDVRLLHYFALEFAQKSHAQKIYIYIFLPRLLHVISFLIRPMKCLGRCGGWSQMGFTRYLMHFFGCRLYTPMSEIRLLIDGDWRQAGIRSKSDLLLWPKRARQ